jgi:hypothetical protein
LKDQINFEGSRRSQHLQKVSTLTGSARTESRIELRFIVVNAYSAKLYISNTTSSLCTTLRTKLYKRVNVVLSLARSLKSVSICSASNASSCFAHTLRNSTFSSQRFVVVYAYLTKLCIINTTSKVHARPCAANFELQACKCYTQPAARTQACSQQLCAPRCTYLVCFCRVANYNIVKCISAI